MLLHLHGLNLSYYTGKVECYFRAKGVAYELVEMDTRDFKRCAHKTGVAQMPQLEFPDGSWLTDSSTIIDFFESRGQGVCMQPVAPDVSFFDCLLEDFADEWLWRPAMYHRWCHPEDASRAADLLARGLLRDVPLPLFVRRWYIQARQRRRFVTGDGVTSQTAPVVEAIYMDVLGVLQKILAGQPYLLGERPTRADFGFFGSMFRHFATDPTPAKIMRDTAPAVATWVQRLWETAAVAHTCQEMPVAVDDSLLPLLKLVCDDYVPYLLANEAAVKSGKGNVRWKSRGVPWTVPVRPYRMECLRVLRVRYGQLDSSSRQRVDHAFQTLGQDPHWLAISN